MLKVELQEFDDLSADEKDIVADNGDGKEYTTYLRVTHNGETLFLEGDRNIEPEDRSFHRDLSWVQTAIARAYALGFTDGSQKGDLPNG